MRPVIDERTCSDTDSSLLSIRRQACSSDTLSTTNPTLIGLTLNPSHRSMRHAADNLSMAWPGPGIFSLSHMQPKLFSASKHVSLCYPLRLGSGVYKWETVWENKIWEKVWRSKLKTKKKLRNFTI